MLQRSNLFQFDPAFLLLSRNMPQRNLLARSALIPLGGCTVPVMNTFLQKYKLFFGDFSTLNGFSMTGFLTLINVRQRHMNWGIWHSSRWWVTYFLCTSFDQIRPNFDLKSETKIWMMFCKFCMYKQCHAGILKNHAFTACLAAKVAASCKL